jgi:hypothetical protein
MHSFGFVGRRVVILVLQDVIPKDRCRCESQKDRLPLLRKISSLNATIIESSEWVEQSLHLGLQRNSNEPSRSKLEHYWIRRTDLWALFKNEIGRKDYWIQVRRLSRTDHDLCLKLCVNPFIIQLLTIRRIFLWAWRPANKMEISMCHLPEPNLEVLELLRIQTILIWMRTLITLSTRGKYQPIQCCCIYWGKRSCG